jgi:hypothetical protein
MSLAGVAPALRDTRGIFTGVGDSQDTEAGFAEETVVFPGRAEQVVADGAAGGKFEVREDAANDEGIAEEKTRTGFEDAEKFAEERETTGNMANDVIRESRVESGIGEKELL